MLKLGALVLVPLFLGLCGKAGLVKRCSEHGRAGLDSGLQTFNQVLILFIVWMALSQSREDILLSSTALVVIALLSAVFHALLLMAAGLLVWLFKIKRGRCESVIFMGVQKTLTLSILLQVSFFSQYPDALTVCVVHHLLHLVMDGYLVDKLRGRAAISSQI